MSKLSYSKQKFSKIYIYVIIFLIIIFIAIAAKLLWNMLKNNDSVVPNSDSSLNLCVEKIIIYSSANATQNDSEVSTSWDLDIYQYSDIAIYLSKPDSLSISNIVVSDIEISKKPQLRFYINFL